MLSHYLRLDRLCRYKEIPTAELEHRLSYVRASIITKCVESPLAMTVAVFKAARSDSR